MPTLRFATFLIVCPTSFFLGILFSLLPYDYPLLWSNPSAEFLAAHYEILETHLKLLYHSPALITRVLHMVMAVGLLGLVIKLYKPSESNILFDGGSLVLYMVAVIVYIANIIPGFRMVDAGVYGVGIAEHEKEAYVNPQGSEVSGDMVEGKEDNLKVVSASNTIMALVLTGVLVLQAGQWYAERADARERRKIVEKEKKEKRERESGAEEEGGSATGSAGVGGPVKRAGSGREGRKGR